MDATFRWSIKIILNMTTHFLELPNAVPYASVRSRTAIRLLEHTECFPNMIRSLPTPKFLSGKQTEWCSRQGNRAITLFFQQSSWFYTSGSVCHFSMLFHICNAFLYMKKINYLTGILGPISALDWVNILVMNTFAFVSSTVCSNPMYRYLGHCIHKMI